MVSATRSQQLRGFFADWHLIWLLLLVPIAFFLPALPIDETRYLAVAWEMRLHADFLVPHLNGAPYSDKPPLLFWLINIGWLVLGMNAWAVRLGVLAASFISLYLFHRLVRRLDPDPALAQRAVLISAGAIYTALFSSAIMFDVVLATWVLVALHGAVDFDQRRWSRGIALFAIGVGLGILTKGPVILLDAGMVVAFGPWWSETARANKARWYGFAGLGVLGGASIALAWAIPAAMSGGPDYASAIFLHQTLDRMTQSFAHQRPLLWYFMVLPGMVLPWTVAVRAPWRAWKESFHISKSARFAVAWFVPAFIAFCLVSGKQPHYLLPILPAFALYFAQVLGRDRACLRGRVFGSMLFLCGLAMAALPYLAAHAHDIGVFDRMVKNGTLTESSLVVFAGVWPLWGILAMALGGYLLIVGKQFSQPRTLAMSSVATAALGMLSLAQGVGSYVDVSVAAKRIAQIQAEGRPITHLIWHHGLYEFAGRLTQPLPAVEFEQLRDWCVAHPNGEVVTFYTKFPVTAAPELVLPYRFGRITFWRAADILTMSAPTTPPKPIAPEDDNSDD
jgi:4-amino-4-deoxy-L-arabinose transferase-like glycosyltransferase